MKRFIAALCFLATGLVCLGADVDTIQPASSAQGQLWAVLTGALGWPAAIAGWMGCCRGLKIVWAMVCVQIHGGNYPAVNAFVDRIDDSLAFQLIALAINTIVSIDVTKLRKPDSTA